MRGGMNLSMIDVSSKPEVFREATAKGKIRLKKKTIILIKEGKIEKGDPLCTARLAAVLAAKNTSLLIPLCHQLSLSSVNVDVRIVDERSVEAEVNVKAKAQTGVEMEALTAASVALLTVWDMTKRYEKDSEGQYPTTFIDRIHVIRKVKE